MYNILIIDDETPITDGIKNIIETHFPDTCTAITCNSSREALQILAFQMVHVIISDVKMPELDGLQLLKILKENDIAAPVIILSGYDNYSYIRTALLNGAHDYLLKPININHFLQMLRTLLETLSSLPVHYLKVPDEYLTQLATKTSGNAASYFDLDTAHDSCCPEYSASASKTHLSRILHSIITGSVSEMQESLNAYFYFRPCEKLTPELIKEEWNQFIYSLMNQYPPVIPVIASYKFTPYDIHTGIKNLPTISQLKTMLANILQIYIEETHVKSEHDKYFIKIAKKYIEDHYSEEITLDDIAAQIHLTPTYFSSLFKANTGITLREYIRQFRMNKAKELLKNPALKIYEISDLVGYPNPTHFNRSFKDMFGISPSEYRQKL